MSDTQVLTGYKAAARAVWFVGWCLIVAGPLGGLLIATREVDYERPFIAIGVGIALNTVFFGLLFVAVGGYIASRPEATESKPKQFNVTVQNPASSSQVSDGTW